MRIAVLNRIFTPSGGGAERYSIALVQELAASHEIHVYAQTIEPCVPGVHYHRVSAPLRRSRWLNQLWYACATCRATRKGFDVVHSHENVWHGNVQTVHVLPLAHTLFHGRVGFKRVLRWCKVLTSPRLLTYLCLERARLRPVGGRQVVATSNSLRAIVLAAFPALAGRVSVITPGVVFPATPSHLRHSHVGGNSYGREAAVDSRLRGNDGGGGGSVLATRNILFAANDYRKKGLATLLKALAQLPSDVQLRMV